MKLGMKVFANVTNEEITIEAIDHYVTEGKDSYYIKGMNISLPKDQWKLKDSKR